MEAARLAERYPVLYHMAEDGSWPSIRERGLLSTSALLDLYEVGGEERLEIESRRRPEAVEITHLDECCQDQAHNSLILP